MKQRKIYVVLASEYFGERLYPFKAFVSKKQAEKYKDYLESEKGGEYQDVVVFDIILIDNQNKGGNDEHK